MAELDGLLDSLEGPPSLPRVLPPPMTNGHRRAAKQAWGMCNGAAKRRGPLEDSAAEDLTAAAPAHEAKHVSILAALQSAKPAGLVDVWREAGQEIPQAQIRSSSSPTISVQAASQHTSDTMTPLQQTPPVRLLCLWL